MNTNNLKRFAPEARRKLLEQVGAKLNYVLTADSSLLREHSEAVKQLTKLVSPATKEQLIEKVAYTWFNRLMALRFMDANDYQPIGVRVISPKEGYMTPEILDEAKRGNIPEELKLNRQKVFDLLDGKIVSNNPQNEAYKLLLIAACNHLNTVFPFLFERINDYTELLMPDDLTSDFSIVTTVREGMPVEDCSNVEIIGWLYQFYISEKKDEVFASNEKVKKEDIPAATQLFTPRWIVEYMVQNTLGKLWLQNRPNSRLRDYMPYFIESASLTSEDYLKISSPEDIRFLDPASGSGHILVYAFDLFTKIYEEEGYNTSDIPKLIIEKNLNGFEIDERAAQLSGLALMMKAREYQRRALRKEIQPNVLCFQDLTLSDEEIKEAFGSLKIKITDGLLHDLLLMKQATNFGSLIIPHASNDEIKQVIEKLNQLKSGSDLFQNIAVDELFMAITQLLKLSEKQHCVVANPPYMGGGNMNSELSQFVKTNYPDSKADLMACFMESGLTMLYSKGYLGMINQHTWMFLSSYDALRKKLIENIFIDTLLHLGARTFPEIGGEVVQNASFTLWNAAASKNGVYIRLVNFDNAEVKRTKTLEAIQNPNCGWFYCTNQKDFNKITGCPIAYWLSNNWLEIFSQEKIGKKAISDGQNITGNNSRYIRFLWEIDNDKINIHGKWSLMAKGGEIRKWYGNVLEVVNWSNTAREEYRKNSVGRIQSEHLWYRKGITWTLVAGAGFRILEDTCLFNKAAPSLLFANDDLKYINILLGFLNTKIAVNLLEVLNPTLNTNIKEVILLPFIFTTNNSVDNLVGECVMLSKKDWDKRELSVNFKTNELVNKQGQNIEEAFDLYQQYWKNKFFQLHKNEEELNRQFIEIYGLQDELTPDVPLEDITILKEETSIVNGELVFKANEVFAQFISYAVGCMFGRYSLYKEGLILANQGETLQDYLHTIEKNATECTLLPDEDNIIPILDDEWFEDDITARFYQFLKVTFGEKNFNKNLTFIEEQLGKDIRKYFTKDFYADHIKRYKKRPIYWMFSSPKGSFNVLIYMHRYMPDTISNILNKYLREFIGKLKTRREHLQHTMVNGTPAQKASAIRENDSIGKMLIELQEYEREVLFPLATERIAIDLDDGVLVNYNKFGKAIKEVSGLNDAATKKKVKQFDWIDAKLIK